MFGEIEEVVYSAILRSHHYIVAKHEDKSS